MVEIMEVLKQWLVPLFIIVVLTWLMLSRASSSEGPVKHETQEVSGGFTQTIVSGEMRETSGESFQNLVSGDSPLATGSKATNDQ